MIELNLIFWRAFDPSILPCWLSFSASFMVPERYPFILSLQHLVKNTPMLYISNKNSFLVLLILGLHEISMHYIFIFEESSSFSVFFCKTTVLFPVVYWKSKAKWHCKWPKAKMHFGIVLVFVYYLFIYGRVLFCWEIWFSAQLGFTLHLLREALNIFTILLALAIALSALLLVL